jgi:glycosyltransferase involved in cell wall biosynthesis
MPKSLPTVHMVVKNEDRFIYYAVKSVLPYVGKIFICDTGSTDKTIEIIKSISDKKIKLTQEHITSPKELSLVRQKQIEETETDWFWIVDGDEIYTERLCREILDIISTSEEKREGIVVGRYDLLGDIYNCQVKTVGTYNLFEKKGHFVLRLINKSNIKGLHVAGIYPLEGYYDGSGTELIHHDKTKYVFTENKLWHAMYLKRSSQGGNLQNTLHRHNYKTERGYPISKAQTLPEVFFQKIPDNIEPVNLKRSLAYEIISRLITPVKRFKRLLIK